jgi:hypothetical protein
LRFIVEICTTRPANIVGVFVNALHGAPTYGQSHGFAQTGKSSQATITNIQVRTSLLKATLTVLERC